MGGITSACAICGRSFTSRSSRRLCCSPSCDFWRWVDRSGGPDACWPWMGHISPSSGYGDVPGKQNHGKRATAHRLAWMLHNCADPGNLCVLHRCDNRKCANPAHLFLGTHRRNMLDAWQKGRPHACAPGSSNRHAKLSEAIVQMIRQGNEPPSILARRYGVCVNTIYSARTGETWKHL